MKINISNNRLAKINKDMYGVFFEDVNYALDGGLCAEMLENRNFEAVFAHGKKYSLITEFDGTYAWALYNGAEKGAEIYCECKQPLNDVNPHYLVFDSKGKDCSFYNKAYDGLYTKRGLNYKVSFYARMIEGASDIKITLRKDQKILEEAIVKIDKNVSKNWKRYECVLHSKEEVEGAVFVVELEEEAIVAFDWFSMKPEDAVGGIFRRDLFEMLKELHPSFVRFPGGCVVEGNTLENRYIWKNSIGPVELRKHNWNRWAVHPIKKEEYVSPYAHYGQTLSVGYYEYFILCEILGAKPLPIMNAGLACQFESREMVDINSIEMEEYIQDALDLIEFANGAADSEWGKIRAEMGHEEPFGLEYLGIGNEQWETEDSKFFARYELFEKRIHERYPEIKLIGSAGPDVTSEEYKKAWEFYRVQSKDNEKFTYAVDEHYYVEAEWMYANTHFYDNYDRNVKVFAGEYACHVPGKARKMNCPEANTLGAALAEAAFMTGVERNADVVVLASYAPLFARMGYAQWSPDMIWFNGKIAYKTPSYYVQQMYSCNRGSYVLGTDWTKEQEDREQVYLNVVAEEDDEIILKVVNASDDEKMLEPIYNGKKDFYETMTVEELHGNPEYYNSFEKRDNIKSVKFEGQGNIVLKPHSFSVIRFKTN